MTDAIATPAVVTPDAAAVAAAATVTPAVAAPDAAAVAAVTPATPAADAVKTPEQIAAEAAAAAPVIPAEYADFNIPEGKTVDPSILADTKAIAKDLGLTQEAAQKLFDKRGELTDAFVAGQHEQIAKIHETWKTTAQADKEIGGTNFDANVGAAKAAFNHFATPEFNKFVTESGIGNHPEMIRLGFKLSKLVSDDTIVPAGRSAPAAVASFYDHPSSKKA